MSHSKFKEFMVSTEFDFEKNKRDLNIPRIYDEICKTTYWRYYSEIASTECGNYWSEKCAFRHPSIRAKIPEPEIDDILYADFFMCDGYWGVNFSKTNSPIWDDFLKAPKDSTSWRRRKKLPDYGLQYILTRDESIGRLWSQQMEQFDWETSLSFGLTLLHETDLEVARSTVLRRIEKGIQKDVAYFESLIDALSERDFSPYDLESDLAKLIL